MAPPQCRLGAAPLASRASVANRAVLQPTTLRPAPEARGALQVRAALGRQAKEDTVERLEALLASSAVVVGFKYQGLTVKQMQGLRRSLPKEGAKILVCKNTLLRRAADTVDGWTELKPAAKGDNAWLFIEEEQIAEGVKAYLGFKQGLIKALPKDQQEDFKLMALSGGAMDGKALAPADILRLEKLPTKLQLIAKIANLLNQVPTKLAVSIKQVPTKVALGVKALADADEDKAKVVGDVCKPSAEAA